MRRATNQVETQGTAPFDQPAEYTRRRSALTLRGQGQDAVTNLLEVNLGG
jgi:hypothetical protein